MGVRIESGDGLLAVSVHPDFHPVEVVHAVFDWVEELDPPPTDDLFGVSRVFETEVGPVGYPHWLP